MDRSLTAEGRLIGRYLLGTAPTAELVERYCRANETLFSEPASEADRAILDFVRTHPRCLPLLESALGLVRPSSILRRKILVMMAVLETSPQHVRHFEPRAVGPTGVVIELVGHGVTAAVKIVAGLLVYAFVRPRRNLERRHED